MSIITVKLLVAAASLFGVAYGCYKNVKDKMPFYFTMIILGVACAAMGRVFEALLQVLTGDYFKGFQIGVLGIVGSILFFFTSNQGIMDRLGDDGSDSMKKCRLLGLIAPLLFFAMWVLVAMSKAGIEIVAVSGMVTAVTMAAGYFHLKHIFLPDVENGIIRCLRAYNIAALIYEILCMCERLCFAYDAPAFCQIIIYAAMGAVLTALLPILERGVKKWTM